MGQAGQEPHTFFKNFIGLTDDQIADMQHGKPVAKVLPTQTPSEVAVFGGVYIHASREDYQAGPGNDAGGRIRRARAGPPVGVA
jgi:antitoxin (DNA-binding transcriptional repressor) of toxin-antitoxin stability system